MSDNLHNIFLITIFSCPFCCLFHNPFIFIIDSTETSGSKVGELLGRYIFLVDEKNEGNISGKKIEQKEDKKSRHVEGSMFQTKCDNEGECMDYEEVIELSNAYFN